MFSLFRKKCIQAYSPALFEHISNPYLVDLILAFTLESEKIWNVKEIPEMDDSEPESKEQKIAAFDPRTRSWETFQIQNGFVLGSDIPLRTSNGFLFSSRDELWAGEITQDSKVVLTSLSFIKNRKARKACKASRASCGLWYTFLYADESVVQLFSNQKGNRMWKDNKWSSLAPSCSINFKHRAIHWEPMTSTLLVCGGHQTTECLFMRELSGKWESLGRLQVARANAAVCFYKVSQTYLISGGSNGCRKKGLPSCLDSIERFDSKTQQWAVLTEFKLPQALCQHRMFIINSQLFLLGGHDGVAVNDNMWMCGLTESGFPHGAWTLIATLPEDFDNDKFFV